MAPIKGEKALVVGAATGYSAAVLAETGVETIALEESPELAADARERGLSVVQGQLEKGHKRGGPYDLILIDGTVEVIPESLVEQLKEGGRLGAGLIDEGGISRLIVGRKAGGGFGFHSLADAADPALPGFRRPRAFTF